ncbi:hypothetical protein HKBW3S44_00474 [Candidatus Hakubella thermalkaliphila]|uniref:Integrase n=4 Tax=Candidatus Hakubella thermalkaliphila TaxID=2754717 RepID=A0A6V8QE62_9ACTN|nr:site-specific integrase [Candidatus Hakubella thermalkaliphila]GFP29329.1 hypothetical protein HKBW3S34_00249 [Candidatus Hakubella thermalkaliphila]GFP36793.1 hypothetical protein HKBW3S44_00474 [Candidatus Hakubella thermalkaliphila]GFP42983.1 hypothetical protein HKBW3C_02115 [Candidatus Hakubella thermalkaliphila]
MASGCLIRRPTRKGVVWAVKFRDQERKQHFKTIGPKKKDAERVLAEVMREVHRGEYRELPNLSFAEFAKRWLEAQAANVRPKTLAGYRQHLKDRIIPYFGRYKLRSITTEMVEAFKARLMEEISAATTGKHLCTLKMALKTAVVWKYLRENPAAYVKPPRHVKPEPEFLEPSEIQALIQATDPGYRCLIATACFTGLRQGELLGLIWGDLDFASGRIYVRRSLQGGILMEPKSAHSRRAVDIPPSLVQMLKEHQAFQAATLEFNELSLIFPNQAGQPMDRSNLQVRIFEPALKKGGLRKIRWHDLRHSYASMLINDGANIKYVQKQLGHASCQVTLDTYSHLIREAGWEAIGKLDGLLSTQGDMVRIAESKVGHEVSMM